MFMFMGGEHGGDGLNRPVWQLAVCHSHLQARQTLAARTESTTSRKRSAAPSTAGGPGHTAAWGRGKKARRAALSSAVAAWW